MFQSLSQFSLLVIICFHFSYLFSICTVFPLTLMWQGNKKRRLLIYLRPFIILVHQLEKAKCRSACQSSLCIPVNFCLLKTYFFHSSQQWRGLEPKSNESAILSKLYHVVHLESKAKIFYSSFVTKRSLNVLRWLSVQAVNRWSSKKW